MQPDPHPQSTLFSRRLAATTVTVLAVASAGYVLWSAAEVFLLMFAGVLFGLFLHGLALPFERYARLPRGVAFIAGGALFFAALVALLWVFGPPLASGVRELAAALPGTIDKLSDRLGATEREVSAAVSERTADLVTPQTLARAFGIFSTLLGGFTAALIVLVTGFYVAAEPRLYRTGVLKLFPKLSRRRVEEVLHALARALGWWLAARLFSMTVVGLLTWGALVALDMPFASTLGLLAGLLSFIPNIGPILSAVPAVLVALAQGPRVGLYVVLVYLGVQAVETYLITPVIERRTVMMPPALVLAAQLIFGTVFGILGLLLASPIALACVVLVKMLYVQDILEDETQMV